MMKSILASLLLALFTTACAGVAPAKWARDLVSELRCGMTVEEVAAKAQKPVKPLDRTWATHLVEDGQTDVWLTFENGRLRSYQVAWVQGLKDQKKEPLTALCGIK